MKHKFVKIKTRNSKSKGMSDFIKFIKTIIHKNSTSRRFSLSQIIFSQPSTFPSGIYDNLYGMLPYCNPSEYR